MKPEDQRRIERAAYIWHATRGPDYSRVNKEISNAKADKAKGEAKQRDYDAVVRAGKKKEAMEKAFAGPYRGPPQKNSQRM